MANSVNEVKNYHFRQLIATVALLGLEDMDRRYEATDPGSKASTNDILNFFCPFEIRFLLC